MSCVWTRRDHETHSLLRIIERSCWIYRLCGIIPASFYLNTISVGQTGVLYYLIECRDMCVGFKKMKDTVGV